MTEKEMIEEMVGDIAKGLSGVLLCEVINLAKTLIGLGYRKIPEGSVVLTNDEWARLRNFEINYDDAYEDYLKYEIENQQLKKQLKELEEQRDRQAYIAEELIQEKHRWTEQARKETAKEFAERLEEKCKELENKYSHLCKSKKECLMETCRYEGVLAVKRELYEIAKQYGVEE